MGMSFSEALTTIRNTLCPKASYREYKEAKYKVLHYSPEIKLPDSFSESDRKKFDHGMMVRMYVFPNMLSEGFIISDDGEALVIMDEKYKPYVSVCIAKTMEQLEKELYLMCLIKGARLIGDTATLNSLEVEP